MSLAAPRLTLLRQQSPLAETARQRQVLGDLEARLGRPFARSVLESQGTPLTTGPIEILQVNVGKLCNQTCHHCHVDAGPERREQMSPETAAACLQVLRHSAIGTLDITGGAPEMNPQFRRLVIEATALGRRVIDRCNLTILTAPGYTDLPEFLAAHRVEIVASLPCYLEVNTDKQRGDGVFQKSLAALRRLNELGYGMPGSDLSLTLVYNPVGPSLPPSQAKLEGDYRRELRARYGLEFTRLFTITNLPISRFLEDLLAQNRLDEYGRKLVDAYNPATLRGLMCRNTLSVDWTGRLYDCDFNQMLELPVERGYPATIFDVADQGLATLEHRPIAVGFHCYGCTASAGSGCQGSVVR
jgi:radical SAM/Cys-rich protein